jgi:hypothetical protein
MPLWPELRFQQEVVAQGFDENDGDWLGHQSIEAGLFCGRVIFWMAVSGNRYEGSGGARGVFGRMQFSNSQPWARSS